MKSPIRMLEDASEFLRDALSNQDWESIAALDLQCREAIESVMLAPSRDEPMLKARMEGLLDVYLELIEACRGERQSLADQLVQVRKSSQGAKVYQLFG